MNRFNRILALPVALTMALGLTLPCFAADYQVSTREDVLNAVDGHMDNQGEDRTVNMILQNDIDMEGNVIGTDEDWTYTFQGKDESVQPNLQNLNIQGAGTVTVNADIQSTQKSPALNVVGGSVTVNGDISSDTLRGTELVKVTNADEVTLNGDLTRSTNGDALHVLVGEGHTDVTVNGNLSTKRDEALNINVGQGASAHVEVRGDLKGEYAFEAVSAGALELEITGNVDPDCENCMLGVWGEGGSADVTLNGDINSNFGGIYLAADENPDHLNYTQNGSIKVRKNEDWDWPVYIKNGSKSARIQAVINGDVAAADAAAPAIVAWGDTEAGENRVIINGSLQGEAVMYEDCVTPTTVLVRTGSSGPSMKRSVTFTGTSLDGREVTEASDSTMVLVYFDPADEESCAQLAQAQTRYGDKGTAVYGVCMTEDYSAAEKAAKDLKVTFPILKMSDSLKAAFDSLVYPGHQLAVMIRDGYMVASAIHVSALNPNGSASYRTVPVRIIPDSEDDGEFI